MKSINRKKLLGLGWGVPLVAAAGFVLALPAGSDSVRINELRLTEEEAKEFTRSVHVGMLESALIIKARNSIDMVTPSTVMNNTSIDMVTPSTVMNSTSIDMVTPSTVMNNTSIDMVTPSTVMNSTSIGMTTPSTVISSADIDEDAISFFPTQANLPKVQVDASMVSAQIPDEE